jgi:hypothetical protein
MMDDAERADNVKSALPKRKVMEIGLDCADGRKVAGISVCFINGVGKVDPHNLKALLGKPKKVGPASTPYVKGYFGISPGQDLRKLLVVAV